MKMHLSTAVFVLLAVVWAGLQSGCDSSKANAAERPRDPGAQLPKASPADRPANVEVVTVTSEPLTRQVIASGVTKSDRDITYSAEIGGRLDFMKLEPGARVKKGQVIARIDYTALSAQAEQTEASLDLARLTHERLTALSAEKIVSQQRVDEARTGLLQAEAASKIAAVSLSKGTVRAQYDGIVAEAYTDQGEFVAPGSPIARIVDVRNLVVEARFAESEISFVRSGALAMVRVESLNEEFQGKVETVVPTADPESKTFKVRIRVENKDERILVGMATRTRVTSDATTSAVLIPHDAVIETGGTRKVFVAQNGIAKARTVTLGQSVDARVAVLEGLDAGDKLIVVGQRDLKEKQPITIVN
ncbi:MAG: efflux RND transporter periplasmic adaptor subunit [Myxococcota bacterium]|jgi:membrane fusion protein (multidrug efflux system)|nr:efflux RND transporter periplasmic adaptor subunit [Myxococcota bacterium]